MASPEELCEHGDDDISLLIFGTLAAVIYAVLFGQLWFLARRYERRGLNKELARHLLHKHFPLFLGCVVSLLNLFSLASWHKERWNAKPGNMQLFLSFISSVQVSVSLFTVLRSLYKLETTKEEIKNVLTGRKNKWAGIYSLYFFTSVYTPFMELFGRKSYFNENKFLEDCFSVFLLIFILFTFISGTAGLVFSLSLSCVMSLAMKYDIISRFYSEEDPREVIFQWELCLDVDVMSLAFLLFYFIMSNMAGSVFHDVYELAVSEKDVEKEVNLEKGEEELSRGEDLLLKYGQII